MTQPEQVWCILGAVSNGEQGRWAGAHVEEDVPGEMLSLRASPRPTGSGGSTLLAVLRGLARRWRGPADRIILGAEERLVRLSCRAGSGLIVETTFPPASARFSLKLRPVTELRFRFTGNSERLDQVALTVRGRTERGEEHTLELELRAAGLDTREQARDLVFRLASILGFSHHRTLCDSESSLELELVTPASEQGGVPYRSGGLGPDVWAVPRLQEPATWGGLEQDPPPPPGPTLSRRLLSSQLPLACLWLIVAGAANLLKESSYTAALFTVGVGMILGPVAVFVLTRRHTGLTLGWGVVAWVLAATGTGAMVALGANVASAAASGAASENLVEGLCFGLPVLFLAHLILGLSAYRAHKRTVDGRA